MKRREDASRSWRGIVPVLAALGAIALAPSPARAATHASPSSRLADEGRSREEQSTKSAPSQDEKRSATKTATGRAKSKPPWADFSYRYDPRDLYREFLRQNKWRRIWGPIGVGEFHIFPARETGPNLGPPLRIWGHGFGTSLWRDPVTGHPIM